MFKVLKILQIPNPPLIIAFVGALLEKVPQDSIHKFGVVLYTVFIIVWAYQEIIDGANWVRRLLGLVVVIWTIYSLFSKVTF